MRLGAWLFLAPWILQEGPVELKISWKAGNEMSWKEEGSADVTVRYSGDEKPPIEEVALKSVAKISGKIRIGEVREAKPSRYDLQFESASVTATSVQKMTGQDPIENRQEILKSVAGADVEMTHASADAPPEIEVRKGTVSAEDQKALKTIGILFRDTESWFLPKKGVSKGDSWKVEGLQEIATRLMNKRLRHIVSQAKVKTVEAKEVSGEVTGRVTNLSGAGEAAVATVAVTGEFAVTFRVSVEQPATEFTLRLKATLNNSYDVSVQGQTYKAIRQDVTYEVNVTDGKKTVVTTEKVVSRAEYGS